MRILYICRLYSGFEDSLRSGVWAPKGSPTIAKMIEYLDQREDVGLTLVFTCKDFGSKFNIQSDQVFKLEGIKTPIHVLAGETAFPSVFGNWRHKLSNIRQYKALLRLYSEARPDLIYCDRVNLMPAAFFARWTQTPVIWRVMGVLENMHVLRTQKSLYASFFRWLWRSPFKTIICTLDGSGGALWLDYVRHPATQTHLLLNGVDVSQESAALDLPLKEKPRLLLAGRIEFLKGIKVFIEAVDSLYKQKGAAFDVLVAGYGGAELWLKSEVQKRGLEDIFIFLGPLYADQMKKAQQNADIYISCGTHGNMTNTTIEALSEGLCCIIPEANPKTGVDLDTDSLILENVAMRYGQQGDVQALARAMQILCDDKNKRQKYAENAREFAKATFQSWRQRIQTEFDIFEKAARSKVAFIISDMGSGGAQKIAAALLNHWAAQGHSVTLITLDDGFHDFFNVNQNVKKVRLGEVKASQNLWQGIWANIRRVWAIRKALQDCAPQSVVSFIAPTNILTLFACIGLKTKVIISERNDPHRQNFGLFWNSLRRFLYRFADVVNANSQGAIETMRSYVPDHKLSFIPNMVNIPDAGQLKSLDERENIIVAVGRLHPQKGFDILLQAMSVFIRKRPGWKLMILGLGPEERSLKSMVKDLGLSHCTYFEGLQKDPATYYQRAQIFVLSSRHEGTPNALLEAMAYGVAPVMSDACLGALNIWDQVPEDLVFENENPESLAQRLLDLSAQLDKAQAYGQAVRQAVMALKPELVFERWDNLL